MNAFEAHILEMLLSVRQFSLAHAEKFPAGSAAAVLFAAVAAAITAMQTHSAAQAQHKRAAEQHTQLKKQQRNALVEMMKAISRTAVAMSRNIPGLENKFRMPEDKREQTLLAVARSFVMDVEAWEDEFVKNGMAANFLSDFKSRVRALEQTIDDRAQKTASRVSSTVAIAAAAESGRVVVRDLDPVMRNIFAGDPAALAEWESASHIERAPQHAEQEEPPNQPPPAND
jgi:K+ transporter